MNEKDDVAATEREAPGPCRRHAPAYNETCAECLFAMLVHERRALRESEAAVARARSEGRREMRERAAARLDSLTRDARVAKDERLERAYDYAARSVRALADEGKDGG